MLTSRQSNGALRPSAERPPAPAACARSRRSRATPSTASAPACPRTAVASTRSAPRPRSRRRRRKEGGCGTMQGVTRHARDAADDRCMLRGHCRGMGGRMAFHHERLPAAARAARRTLLHGGRAMNDMKKITCDIRSASFPSRLVAGRASRARAPARGLVASSSGDAVRGLVNGYIPRQRAPAPDACPLTDSILFRAGFTNTLAMRAKRWRDTCGPGTHHAAASRVRQRMSIHNAQENGISRRLVFVHVQVRDIAPSESTEKRRLARRRCNILPSMLV